MTYRTLVNSLRLGAAVLTMIALIVAIAIWLGISTAWASATDVAALVGSSAIVFLCGFLLMSVVLTLAMPLRIPRLIFLLGLFPLLVGWRIAALSNMPALEVLCAVSFLCFVAMFFTIAVHGLRNPASEGRPPTTYASIQLAFVRLYVGLDLVPHFSEKLFAGPVTRAGDVQAFEQLGVPNALQFVLLAGVIEFAAAIGVGLGVFTRLACVLTVVYLMVATLLGHHFLLGFIWASPGGGWEYPVLWSVLILSFVFGGGRWMSLDEVISEHIRIPGWIKNLMGDTSSHCDTRM